MKRGERKPLSTVSWKLTGQVYGVLTAREVANGWHKHYKTVLLACTQGRLIARKSGSCWLISYRSVKNLWGNPVEREVHENLP